MTATPRPAAFAELHGNTVRIIHGPIRLTIATDTPLPHWAWPKIACLAEQLEALGHDITHGTDDEAEPAEPLAAARQTEPHDSRIMNRESDQPPAVTETIPAHVVRARANGAHGGRPATVDHAEVARIAREARANGIGAKRAIAEHYGITQAAANQRLIRAGQLGHDCGTPLHGGGPRRTAETDGEGRDPVTDLETTTPTAEPDDDEYEPLTWGVNGKLPVSQRARVDAVNGMYEQDPLRP